MIKQILNKKKLLTGPIVFAISLTCHATGVITGGGGSTVPANPATPADVQSALETARYQLKLYFNFESLNYRPSDFNTVGTKLFNGPTTILDIINSSEIQIEANGPCHDPSGNDKDGAAPGTKPNSICISLKNLAEKLTQDNFRPQTLALVAHEFSHLLGTNEDEAILLQNIVLTTMSATSEEELLSQMNGVDRMVANHGSNGGLLFDLKSAISDGSPNYSAACIIADQLRQFQSPLLYDFRHAPLPFSIYSSKNIENLEGLRVRSLVLKWFLCSKGGLTSDDRQGSADIYSHLFSGASQISLNDYEIIRGNSIEKTRLPNPADFKLRNISSMTDLNSEIADLESELESIRGLLTSVQGR